MIVNMHEAKTHLSRLVERVAAGDEVIIGRAGRPVARLVPFVEHRRERVPGALRGKLLMADDFDVTDPDLIDAFEGEG